MLPIFSVSCICCCLDLGLRVRWNRSWFGGRCGSTPYRKAAAKWLALVPCLFEHSYFVRIICLPGDWFMLTPVTWGSSIISDLLLADSPACEVAFGLKSRNLNSICFEILLLLSTFLLPGNFWSNLLWTLMLGAKCLRCLELLLAMLSIDFFLTWWILLETTKGFSMQLASASWTKLSSLPLETYLVILKLLAYYP